MKFLARGVLTCAMAVVASTSVQAQTVGASIECGQTYSISPGDTLSRISVRAYGARPFQPLYQHNRQTIGPDPDRIIVGQVIEIPCFAADGSVITESDVAEAEPAPEETPAAQEVVDAQEEPSVEEAAPEELASAQEEPAPAEQGSQSDTVVLTFNKTSAPPFIINSGIIDPYLAEITEATEGRVQFVDPDTMIRVQDNLFRRVTSGEVDAAYVLNSTLVESHPLLQLPMVPLMGGSAEQTAVSLWQLHEAFLSQTTYFDDAQLLGFIAAPAAHIWRETSEPVLPTENVIEKNVYSVPYFQGLDIRGPAALQEEVADFLVDYSAENSGPPTFFLAHGAARALGIWTDRLTVTEVDFGVYTPTFSVVLSNEAWARISPDDQQTILELSGEKLSHRSASWDAFDNGFRADMLENGLKFVKADEALLENLRDSSTDRMQAWMSQAQVSGIQAFDALEFYLASLRSMENRLLFR